ncbi:MAG: metallophosphoesterase [Myxococcales bacterium]|nr:metallophosphoesterase [Myxococcales bacterium]
MDQAFEGDILISFGEVAVKRSTIDGLLALAVAATFAHCGQSDVLPLIARGDAVRVIGSGDADCPTGWGERDFDDTAWQSAKLPIAAVPEGGVCLRKQFDISAALGRYRWLTIRLSSHSRARLNSGKPITSDQERGGIDWSTEDDAATPAPRPIATREYTLDLRLFPTLLQPHANVLALQVPQTRDPVDIEANLRRDDNAASDFVRVVKGPYRVRPTGTSTRIAWESDRSAPSWLVVDGKQYDGGWAIHHEVEVGGLVAGRVYSFYVSAAESSALPPQCQSVVGRSTASAHLIEPNLADDDFWKYVERRDACNRVAQAIHSDPRALRAPPLGAPLRVVIVGDTRADDAFPRAVLEAASAEAPDLVVHTGDLVASGSEADWQAFFDASAGLMARAPLAPVPGERDNAPWGDRFAQLFGGDGSAGRTYAVDVGAVHLALLDSTASLADQAVWLERDLTAAEAGGARHILVVMHSGPYSSGRGGGNLAARAVIEPVVRRHRVEALLSGHDNVYEHGVAAGLHYFVTGGAGGMTDGAAATATTVMVRALPHYLVLEVDGERATMRAKDVNGTVFDEVALAP